MSHGSSAGSRASVPRIHLPDPGGAPPAGSATRLEFAPQGFARRKFRVLVAHDLTSASEIALVRAARLAAERDGHLTILHVVDSELPAAAIAAKRAQARKRLETEARRWLPGDRPYRIDVGIGDPAGAITARAQAHDIDVIVTPRHTSRASSSDLTPAMVGRLLRQTERPVLVIANSDQSPYRRVLAPVDLTPETAAGVRLAAALLPQASFHLLHACRRSFLEALRPLIATIGGREAAERLAEPTLRQRQQALSCFVEGLDLGDRRPRVSIEPGDPLALIKAELARQKTDLLILGARAKSPAELALLRHTASITPGAGACDILFHSSATREPCQCVRAHRGAGINSLAG